MFGIFLLCIQIEIEISKKKLFKKAKVKIEVLTRQMTSQEGPAQTLSRCQASRLPVDACLPDLGTLPGSTGPATFYPKSNRALY